MAIPLGPAFPVKVRCCFYGGHEKGEGSVAFAEHDSQVAAAPC